MRIWSLTGVSLLAIGMGLGAAEAQQRRAIPKNASEVIVTNARTVALTGLEITTAKGEKVATLKKPLEPGKKLTYRFRPRNGCIFTVNAAFADESGFDPTEVDLCTDKNVRFTE